MRPIDVREQGRGAVFGVLGMLALVVIVLMGFFALAVPAGCSTRGAVGGDTAEAEKKSKGPPVEIADVAGEEAIRAKLAEAERESVVEKKVREATALLAAANPRVDRDRKGVAETLRRVVRGNGLAFDADYLKKKGVRV